MNKNIKYISGSKASEILGISQNTLRKYADNNIIEFILTPGKQRRYDISSILNINNKNKKNICYCRVSTHGQRNNLSNQIIYMKNKYPIVLLF